MGNGKSDAGKNRLDLVFPILIEEVGRVRTYGTQKYGDSENWKTIANPIQRYTAAAMRHFEAFRKGEFIDPESGLPHLAHCACNLMFLLELSKASEGNLSGQVRPGDEVTDGILEKSEVNRLLEEKSCSKCAYEKLLVEYEPCASCYDYDEFVPVPDKKDEKIDLNAVCEGCKEKNICTVRKSNEKNGITACCSICKYSALRVFEKPCDDCYHFNHFTVATEAENYEKKEIISCKKCIHNDDNAWEEPCVNCVNLSNFTKKDEK